MHKIVSDAKIVTRVTPALAKPAPSLLDCARAARATGKEHARFVRALDCLHEIEYRPPPRPETAGDTIRIAAWNAERCKYLPQSAGLLRAAKVDVALLSELDIGMARSGNRRTISDLAAALAMGHAFGVEYVELGLGDDREKAWHAGETNTAGLHGNGIVTSLALDRLALFRLDEGARWFGGRQSTQERRIGWRMALGAEMQLPGGALFVVTAHLESSTDREDRATQVRALIAGIEAHAPGLPVVIGGDFNTSDLPPAEGSDPGWFSSPEAFEPLFADFAAAGFAWRAANRPMASERTRPDGTPVPPFRKIDWFFTRGLDSFEAETIPAVDDAGRAISDHEMLVVTVARREGNDGR